MDRFIDLFALFFESINIYLKSSMDRFIEIVKTTYDTLREI